MKLIICLLSALFLTQAFQFLPRKAIQTQGLQPYGENNVQFADQRGPGCSEDELYYFLTYVNDASTFYRDDFKNSLSYVSSFMEKKYKKKYSVITQKTAGAYFGFYVWTVSGQFATLAAKSDSVMTNNSYLMVANTNQSGQFALSYVSEVEQAGNGISEAKKTIIKNIVLSVEPASCTCIGTTDISSKLTRYDNGKWNVICSSYPDLYGQIWVKGGAYYYTKPKNCYYLAWITVE